MQPFHTKAITHGRTGYEIAFHWDTDPENPRDRYNEAILTVDGRSYREGWSLHEAAKLAERIREVIAAVPFALTEHIARSLTVSVGVASIAPGRHETDLKAVADRLLADADAALYRAKALGRNRVQVGSG